MGVLTTNAARGDIAFTRGMTFKWGVRWRRSTDGGRTFRPVDLTAYTVRVQLLGLDENVWLDKPCDTAGVDGVAIARLQPGDTSGDMWRGRRSGIWRITAAQAEGDALIAVWTPPDGATGSELRTMPDLESGESTVIAWGYWRAG